MRSCCRLCSPARSAYWTASLDPHQETGSPSHAGDQVDGERTQCSIPKGWRARRNPVAAQGSCETKIEPSRFF